MTEIAVPEGMQLLSPHLVCDGASDAGCCTLADANTSAGSPPAIRSRSSPEGP